MLNSDNDWLLGFKAADPIVKLADKFKDLTKKEAEAYYGKDIPKYVPWLAAKYSRDILKAISIAPPEIPKGQLVVSRDLAETLAKAFNQAGKHGVAAIVPQDIGTKIYTGYDLNLLEWNQVVSYARSLLLDTVPWLAHLYSRIIDCIVAIEHKKDGLPTKRGFSTPLCYGAIFLSFEDRMQRKESARVEMAIDLSHELGHHVLHTYQTADNIIAGDLEVPVYSSVRRTNRPAIMSLHASAALAYMLETAFVFLSSNMITAAERVYVQNFIKTYYHEQQTGLKEIGDKCQFTELGAYLFDEMRSQLKRLEGIIN